MCVKMWFLSQYSIKLYCISSCTLQFGFRHHTVSLVIKFVCGRDGSQTAQKRR